MCILLVEDEPVIRTVLAEFLKDDGLAVCEAANADQATAAIDRDPDRITLLLTDIHMPGQLSGIDVARKLRALRPEIPVIYMTGQHGALNGLGSVRGRYALVTKPFAPSEMLATVRRLLGA